VAERPRAKTQLTGVSGAALIILMVRAAPGLFGNLRQFALDAMALPHHCPWPTSQERCGRGGNARRNSFCRSRRFLGVALLGVLPGARPGDLPGSTPLFFVNAKTFRDEARRLANTEPKARWIVIVAEPVTGVDTTASDVVAVLVVAHAEDENGVTSKAIGDQMIVEDEAIVSYTTHLDAAGRAWSQTARRNRSGITHVRDHFRG
jgi:hypothetical protein